MAVQEVPDRLGLFVAESYVGLTSERIGAFDPEDVQLLLDTARAFWSDFDVVHETHRLVAWPKRRATRRRYR